MDLLNMRARTRSAALLVLLTVCCSEVSSTRLAAAEKVDLSQYYGFDKLEIFKLEKRSGNLLAGDLNNDGLTDLVLVDNSHSRIDVLQQRRDWQEAVPEAEFKRSVNFIENDRRFEHRKISVDKQVAALALGDFNGDGRTDLAYFGVPDRLIVRYQAESGEWTERTDMRLPDVQPTLWIVAAGDLNADDRDDLAVLGKSETYVIYQDAEGKLGTPLRMMNTSEKLGLAQIADLDGDGRNDLCYLADGDQSRALCARLQTPDGQLGPELQFELDRPRSVSLANIDGAPGQEILAIESQTGRVKIQQLQRPAVKAGEIASRLIQFGIGTQSAGKGRDLATGDIDGDGLMDVVVSDPERARVIVFRQRKPYGLDLGTPFPGLDGAEQIRMADLLGDASAEVVVLSEREKTLGLCQMEGDRLTFPQTLPTEDEPVAVELADLSGDGRAEVVYVSRKRDGRTSTYALRALQVSGENSWGAVPFGSDQTSVKLELRGTPERLMGLDANADGRTDFLVFFGLDRAPLLLVTNEQGVPTPAETSGGIQLGEVSAGAVSIGELDKPVVLVAQGKFARNLKLDNVGRWQVVDQYNASESNAKIVGTATLNLDGEPGNEVVLIDVGVKKLRVMKQDGSLYRPWREVEIGSFPFEASRVADLNGDGHDDLLLFGKGQFAVLYAGRTDPTLKEIASFETKLEEVYLSDTVAGDINGDGHADVAVIDTRSHFIELLNFDAKKGLRHALHFKLFDQKSFSRDNDSGTEPREALIVDVTNDKRPDLVLLTHDRILLFPQDDGK